MFTRYSNIEIPKNYSGNRFKKTIIEDTTMKTHENDMQGAVKSSVSPTYSEHLYQNEVDSSNISNDNDAFEFQNDVTEQELEINDDIAEGQDSEIANHNTEKSKSSIVPFLDYFKDIKSDDLLLILLIIFLASDKSSHNNDIIMLLALLLTSK
ncbi:MAG: hypothetical protein II984_06935 [Clostridia bacterium]|nr:hypothetical protein [Clostridia bacterium]